MSADQDGGLVTGAVDPPPRRRVRDALLRIATVALGASLPAGVVGALLFGFTLLTGDAAGIADLPVAFLGFATAALVGGAVLVALEEVALASRRPGVVMIAALVALVSAALCMTAATASAPDRHMIVAMLGIVAGPVTALGLVRSGGYPGSGGAPMSGSWQVVFFSGIAALEAQLMVGPLCEPLGLSRDQGTAELVVPIVIVGVSVVGALPCLAVGDLLARRWVLDPRPAPAGSALVRGLGALLVVLLLIAVVAALVATRGLQVAIDAWHPRLVVSAIEAAQDDASVLVRGRVSDASAVTVTLVRDPWSSSPVTFPVAVAPDGAFSVEVPLVPGYTTLQVIAEDRAHNRTEVQRHVETE